MSANIPIYEPPEELIYTSQPGQFNEQVLVTDITKFFGPKEDDQQTILAIMVTIQEMASHFKEGRLWMGVKPNDLRTAVALATPKEAQTDVSRVAMERAVRRLIDTKWLLPRAVSGVGTCLFVAPHRVSGATPGYSNERVTVKPTPRTPLLPLKKKEGE